MVYKHCRVRSTRKVRKVTCSAKEGSVAKRETGFRLPSAPRKATPEIGADPGGLFVPASCAVLRWPEISRPEILAHSAF